MEFFDSKGNAIPLNNLQQDISIFLSNENTDGNHKELRGVLNSQNENASYRIPIDDDNSSLYLEVNATKLTANCLYLLRLHKSGTPLTESYSYQWNGSLDAIQRVVPLNGSGVYFLSLTNTLVEGRNTSLNLTGLEVPYRMSISAVGCLYRNGLSGLWSAQGCQVGTMSRVANIEK